MSVKTWILLLLGLEVYLRSSAKFCVRRFVNGKWISKGDCGGPGRILGMQKIPLLRNKEYRMKCIVGTEWTVFQRRINGDVDFYRGWEDYKKGFGDCDGDLWLGLEELHERTKEGDMELEIHMITKDDGIHWWAKYSVFRIGPGSDRYRLHVSGFSGNATEDGLSPHNNHQFSTNDVDRNNCASYYESAWWYDNCYHSNLNGNFNKTDVKGIRWWNENLRFSEMKFRKRL